MPLNLDFSGFSGFFIHMMIYSYGCIDSSEQLE